jgi:hypothetical protein
MERILDFFQHIDPILGALIATVFTWLVTRRYVRLYRWRDDRRELLVAARPLH